MSSLFTWKPEYSVHEPELDRHHQKLFTILNSVYENVMNSTEVDHIIPKIDELSAYTSYHFSAEEQHMLEAGFSGLDEHITKHREFANSIEALRASYHNNDLEVSRDLIIVLGEWLLHHVIKEDRKYSKTTHEATTG